MKASWMKMAVVPLASLIVTLGFIPRPLFAQGGSPETSAKKEASGKKDEAPIKIEFDDLQDEKKEEERRRDDASALSPYAPPIEQLFRDPGLRVSLTSNAEAINRSVETLMDSLFYSVLDNEKNVYLTKDFWFNGAIKRDVYSSGSGAYVVVDRFTLGPRYQRELWRVQNIPVTLGIDGSVDVLQIYLRSDGMRLAEQEELSPLRRMANNWFGLVPGLASILPPSFNQNELYDPIRELETPFSFPLSASKFYSMPIGSIRSYSLSGGIRLSPDIGGLLDKPSQDILARAGGLTAGVPYSIFKRGEHRINVLRRKEHIAWVGVADLNRTGHGISPTVAQNFFVLHGLLAAKLARVNWVWAGVPIAVLPINVQMEQALVDLFDQVYEFDLRNPAASEAYTAAVQGDFAPARQRYLEQKEKGDDTGVTFHFARQQTRQEVTIRNGPNIAVLKDERARTHDESEIEITDPDGKFYVLETSLDVHDKRWNILVGEEDARAQETVEMKVKRVPDPTKPTDPKAFTYAFEADPSPYRLLVSLNINDRYVDTDDYAKYIKDLRFFTALNLETVPILPRRDAAQEVAWRQKGYFIEPNAEINLVHVTPTYLGRFGAQAIMSFDSDELRKIASRSEDEMWAAFATAYGLDPLAWRDPLIRSSFGFQSQWFLSFILYPLRLFNVRSVAADAIFEATNVIKALREINSLSAPLAKIAAFRRVLDVDHPRELARTLLDLADPSRVPRRVTFSAQPSGPASEEVKKAYGKLNSLIFRAGPQFPQPSRYVRAKSELAQFYLDQPRDAEEKPHLAKIQVTTREIPASVRSLSEVPEEGARLLNPIDRHVFITFNVRERERASGPIKLFVRIEQAGKIKLGKLELAEKVVDLWPVDASKGRTSTYELFLTGPLSPLNSYSLEEAVTVGDDFGVTLAVSRDGYIWSEERELEFKFEHGKLLPIE